MIGKTLGSYEIQDLLGKGGMGEVYKAKDARLGRTVAIKILPKDVSENAEVKERFTREAKMISSLSHAHVCALYDIGNDEGVDYLVMEYLEGETLAERLKSRGALPLDEARRIGMQIADALDAAHRHGIVHRDLKPGNVMLTTSGVKLLDFGLAKEAEAGDDKDAGLTALQTEAAENPLTQEGTILGTLQYMAPEQLEGKRVDARTDIFALGLLLYEMVSGKRAFAGDSQASLIASIMSSQPQSMSSIAPVTPPSLERLVNACLAKNPEERIQSAHDVRLQLQWIKADEPTSGNVGTAVASAAAPSSSRGSWLSWALVVLLALLSLWMMSRSFRQAEVAPPVSRLSIVAPQGLDPRPEPAVMALSPDGTQLAFEAADSTGVTQLWVRSLAQLEPVPVPHTEFGLQPFWSPDGRHLGFFQDGKMKRVALSGNRTVQVICDARDGRGGAWNVQDEIVFAAVSAGPLYVVSASGGTPRQITTVDEGKGQAGHRYPKFLPNGRDFLYAAVGGTQHVTVMASLDNETSRELLVGEGLATYAHPGYLLYEVGATLMAARFDPETGDVSEKRVALRDAPQGTRNYFGCMPVRTADDGTMVYFKTQEWRRSEWRDRQGRILGAEPIPRDQRWTASIRPQQDFIAISRLEPHRKADLWLYEVERKVVTRITFEGQDNYGPVWSRDGSILAYSSRREGSRNIYYREDGGTGPEKVLLKTGSVFDFILSWPPDGLPVLVRTLTPETKNDLIIYDRDKDELRPLIATPFEEQSGMVSHSGKWVAYLSDETGRLEVYIQSYPQLGKKVQVSVAGSGFLPGDRITGLSWSPDDTELTFVSTDLSKFMAVQLTEEGDRLKVGRPRVLFEISNAVLDITSSDHQRFLLGILEDASTEMVLVRGWAEEIAAEFESR